MLRFTQTNLHRAAQATVMLGQELEGLSQSINFICEPHTTQGKITGFPRGTNLIYDKSIKPGDPPPRAGIITDRSVNAHGLDHWSNRDCAVATARLHGKQTLLASIYLDITMPTIPDWLEKLVCMADTKKLPLIVGIDTNAHSCLYGPDNNTRGDQFEDFVIEHGLQIINHGSAPTFETRRGNTDIQTHIDVTLARDLHFELSNWRVDRSYNASDHNTIRFEAPPTPTEPQEIRPWSSADWRAFSSALSDADYRIPSGISMKKLDRLTDRLYTVLEDALDTACPRTTVLPTIQGSHWATDKHTEAKKKVTNLYQKAKRTGTHADWELYKQADKKFKHMCKRDRNKAWREYKESLQSQKEMASLAKLAQREERREVNVLTKTDGTTTEPGTETIGALTSAHFPSATDRQRVTYNNRRNCLTMALEDKYNDWINPAKIRRALDGFKKKKSPGPDGIKPLIFEHLPPTFLTTLETIYKACIHLGYTPKAWKRTRVIFISKPGKDSYDKAKSFRPISLSNYFLKGLERLVGWKMDTALLTYPIHHKQHGFQTGKSTESAISNTTNYIEQFIMKKQHCVGIFLDISSAFDSIKASHVRLSLIHI